MDLRCTNLNDHLVLQAVMTSMGFHSIFWRQWSIILPFLVNLFQFYAFDIWNMIEQIIFSSCIVLAPPTTTWILFYKLWSWSSLPRSELGIQPQNPFTALLATSPALQLQHRRGFKGVASQAKKIAWLRKEGYKANKGGGGACCGSGLLLSEDRCHRSVRESDFWLDSLTCKCKEHWAVHEIEKLPYEIVHTTKFEFVKAYRLTTALTSLHCWLSVEVAEPAMEAACCAQRTDQSEWQAGFESLTCVFKENTI